MAAFIYFRPLVQPLKIDAVPSATKDPIQAAAAQQTPTLVSAQKGGICSLAGSMMILNLSLFAETPSRRSSALLLLPMAVSLPAQYDRHKPTPIGGMDAEHFVSQIRQSPKLLTRMNKNLVK